MKDYLQFYEGPQVQKIIENNFETISEGYLKFAKQQKYTKLSQPSDFQMSFAAYKKFGHDMKIYPTIISFDDFSYIFKMITKEKSEKLKPVKQDVLLDEESKLKESEEKLNDKETLNITFNEFKDALCRIACISKYKLGGLQGITEEECITKDRELKQYLKSRWNKTSNKNNSKQGKPPIKEEKKSNPNKSVLNPQTSKSSRSPSPNKNKFEKPKKLSKEEKEKIEHDHALNAARSFSLKNFKAGKSVNRTALPAIIYEDAELNIFPEIDTENMTEATFTALILFIKEILDTEKKGGNINLVKLQKASNKTTDGGSPNRQQVK